MSSFVPMEKRRENPAISQGLSCPLCTKTFENDKQTTRHIRYCRTKAKDGGSTRRKSCAACVKAKTRCNTAFPNCSRCWKKGIECQYRSSNGLLDLATEDIPPEARVVPQYEVAAARDDVLAPSANTWPDVQSKPTSNNVDQTIFSEGIQDLVLSDSISLNFEFDSLLTPQIQYFKDRVLLGSFYVVSNLDSYVPFDATTIQQKQSPKAGPHGSAVARAYCVSTLKSYPGMMGGSDGILPPFIHAPLQKEMHGSAKARIVFLLPEPLAICSSILKMYTERSVGTSAFVWRTIQGEVLRMDQEYESYDTSNTLAALQALTIYVLLGLFNDTSEYIPDGNFLLCMLNIKKRIVDKHWPVGWMCNEIRLEQIPDWEEWVLAESRRRTCIILVFIIHIFAIEHAPGVPTCGGFADLPLPCSRKLWQASDRVKWEAEYRKEYMRDGGSGGGVRRLPTYRDLMPDLQDGSENSGMEHLNEWFSVMDDLGMLVMMAVSTL